uniref:Uncharacterized protein n=1 Tax=Glossina palpalis gambiensis TaxID=67801 RepID=A0A1B0BUZ4_9MUSC
MAFGALLVSLLTQGVTYGFGIHGGSTTGSDSIPILGEGKVNSMPPGGTLKVTSWAFPSKRGQNFGELVSYLHIGVIANTVKSTKLKRHTVNIQILHEPVFTTLLLVNE